MRINRASAISVLPSPNKRKQINDMFKLFKKKDKIKRLGWKDISIKKVKEINEAIANTPDDETVWALIGICYSMTPEEVDNLPLRKAEEYARGISFLNTEPAPAVAKKSYVLNGRKYNATLDFTKVTTAQYIDFQGAWPDSQEHPERILSIILIPDGHRYNDGYDTTEVQQDIENYLSCTDSMGLTLFFCRLLRLSIRSASRKMKRMLRSAKKEGKMTEEQMATIRKIIQLSTFVNGLSV